MRRDHRVDDYLATLPAWQRDVLGSLRELIHSLDPGIEETIKRTNRPYFTLNGTLFAFLGTKDHVNLFIYDPIAADPGGVVNQGEGNQTARTVKIYQDKPVDEAGLRDLLENVVANDKNGGWRKLP